MSFRMFIYYCALCGGWAAFFGWAFGRFFNSTNDIATAGVRGLLLGLMVALGLSLLDALWNLSLRQMGSIILRVGTSLMIGAVGGLFGGVIGQALLDLTQRISNILAGGFYVFGWTLTGLLVGASIGVFEMLSSLVRQKDVGFSIKKLVKVVVGGTAGGLLGGLLSMMLVAAFTSLFSGKDRNALWTPTAMGFVALGMCIGLLIGLAQVILKEAWIKVEAGFRPGREMILAKDRTIVGRAEGSDIALFGDQGVEKLHAIIVLDKNRYYLEDSNTPGGTFVNDQQVKGRAPLNSGDLIRMGKSLLRFNERQKKR